MTSDLEARLSAASTFLLQSPPGEVDDCFNDVRAIVGDDAALEVGILPALQRYNEEQFVLVELEGKKVLITEASKLEDGRYVEPRSGVSFAFDHMRVAASDPKPIASDPETECLRSELDKIFAPYVANHYSEGTCAVYALNDPAFPTPEPIVVEEAALEVVKDEAMEIIEENKPEEEEENVKEEKVEEEKMEIEVDEAAVVEGEEPTPAAEDEVETPAVAEEEELATPASVPEPTPTAPALPPPIQSRIFGLYLVGNKYNPSNYWTGRWRSVYKVDYAAGTLTGTTSIAVHYYEQGNVQLSTTLTSSVPLPASPSAPSIIALLKLSESAAQTKVAEAYASLAEEGFRGLRRALPKTRSKLDWAKIASYRLGNELGGAVGPEV